MSNKTMASALALGAALLLGATTAAAAPECKSVHANLVEVKVTEGCDAGLADCFLGEITGNHGLRGVTHFKADSAAAGPRTGSSGFWSYSGPFQYRTAEGNLDMRETGVTNLSSGLPQSGAVTAYQQIVGGTGLFEGATGFLFVSGRNISNVVETTVSGEICFAN